MNSIVPKLLKYVSAARVDACNSVLSKAFILIGNGGNGITSLSD